MSINKIGSDIPIQVSTFGGTGNASLTDKGIIYGNNTSALGVTSVGTAGQVLTSNGGVSAPSFQGGSGSGNDLVFVQSFAGAVSGGSAINFTTGFDVNYTNYLIFVNFGGNVQPSASANVGIQLSTDGGASYITEPGGTPIYYNSRINTKQSAGSAWNYNFRIGTMAFVSTSVNSTIIYLGGIMKNTRPFMISRSSDSFKYGVSHYINSPITANAFRIIGLGFSAGMTATGTIYKLRTT